jgi:hypothetical protein
MAFDGADGKLGTANFQWRAVDRLLLGRWVQNSLPANEILAPGHRTSRPGKFTDGTLYLRSKTWNTHPA